MPESPSRRYQYNHTPGRGAEQMGIIGASNPVTKTANTNLSKSSEFGYIPNSKQGAERLFQYPLDLGNDATHYMTFHIYQSTGGVTLKDDEWFGERENIFSEAFDNHARYRSAEATTNALGDLVGAFGNMFNWSAAKDASDYLKNKATEHSAAANRQSVLMQDTQNEIDNQDALAANQRRYQSANAWKSSGGKGAMGTRINEPSIRSKDSVVLYMPQKINSMNMLDYEMEDMSTVQQARGTLESLMGAGGAAVDGDGGAFLGNLFKAGTDLGGLAVTKIGGAIGDATASLGMGNPMSALKAYGRVSINPQKEMLFNAPAPRKYEFAFEFAPRNEEESIMVRNIIQLFKFHAYPSMSQAEFKNPFGDEDGIVSGAKDFAQGLAGRAFYDMPSEFQFEYRFIDRKDSNEISVENHYLNKSERCVLTEINVDYSGAGAFQTFDNGAPTHVTLTLTFSEARLLTREHISRGY